ELVAGTVAADGDKVAPTGTHGLAREVGGLAGLAGLDDVDLDARLPQPRDDARGPLATHAAARGWVDDGEQRGGVRVGHEVLGRLQVAQGEGAAERGELAGERVALDLLGGGARELALP